MDKFCTSHQPPRSQRRINGLQLPLNCQQVIGWIVLLVTALLNFIILIQLQFREMKFITLIAYIVLYISHVIFHATATLTDASEDELRNLEVNTIPEFDRSLHAHVIENGRCHLCNIQTSSKTKHCSLCNKCVDNFDHHCKWLNNCIGRRNYVVFLACVTTALMISLLTLSLCLTDIVLFFKNRQQLSSSAQNFINCTLADDFSSIYCGSSISFLVFLIIFGFTAAAIACPLLYLCCFHVYISVLGVSTYEYVMTSDASQMLLCGCFNDINCCKCGRMDIQRKLYIVTKSKDKNRSPRDRSEGGACGHKMNKSNLVTGNTHQSQGNNVTSLISNLISDELDRAKKIIIFDKNKIQPHDTEIV